MTYNFNDKVYNIIVEKKKTTKNIYIRVKSDLNIYITCNYFTTDKMIKEVIENNVKSINRMILKEEAKKDKENKFLFLGQEYDIVRINEKGIHLGSNKVFISNKMDEKDIEKWYRKEALKIFSEVFKEQVLRFNRKIPMPNLLIRKMTTRWGVCNTKTLRITLNLELIKKPIYCLEYVIIHELSHLIEANHSKRFWDVVSENYPNYKEVRKILKD